MTKLVKYPKSKSLKSVHHNTKKLSRNNISHILMKCRMPSCSVKWMGKKFFLRVEIQAVFMKIF